MTAIQTYVRAHMREPNFIAYAAILLAAILFPITVQFATNGNADYLVGLAADGGV